MPHASRLEDTTQSLMPQPSGSRENGRGTQTQISQQCKRGEGKAKGCERIADGRVPWKERKRERDGWKEEDLERDRERDEWKEEVLYKCNPHAATSWQSKDTGNKPRMVSSAPQSMQETSSFPSGQ
jgi:hypothetical protein